MRKSACAFRSPRTSNAIATTPTRASAIRTNRAIGVRFGVSHIALKYLTEVLYGGLHGIARVDSRVDCRVGAGVLGLGSRIPARSGRGRDRVHLRGRQPV